MTFRCQTALSAGGAVVLLSLGVLLGAPVHIPAATSLLCRRMAQFLAQPDSFAIAALVTLASFALIAFVAAVLQARRTHQIVDALVAARTTAVPDVLRAVIYRAGATSTFVVVQSDELIALCHGFRRPRLVFSTGLISALHEDELEAVVRHELAHARTFDPVRNLVARSLSTALFLFPLSAGLARAYVCGREISADRAAVTEMDGDVLPLASALRRTLEARGQFDSAMLAIGGLSATDIRIDRLLGVPTSPSALISPPGRMQTVAFVFAGAALLCVMLASLHAANGIYPCMFC